MAQRAPPPLDDPIVAWGANGPLVKSPPPTYEKRPPPYSQLGNDHLTLAKLPTYEDFETQHESDDEFPTRIPTEGIIIADADFGVFNLQHVEHIDRFEGSGVAGNAAFVYAFVLSLCLNWVGFLAAYTYSGSTSGRCGAMSGFGLSLIKMGFLMRQASVPAPILAEALSGDSPKASADDGSNGGSYMPVFTLLLILIGIVMFARGTSLYLRYRRQLSNIFAPGSLII